MPTVSGVERRLRDFFGRQKKINERANSPKSKSKNKIKETTNMMYIHIEVE